MIKFEFAFSLLSSRKKTDPPKSKKRSRGESRGLVKMKSEESGGKDRENDDDNARGCLGRDRFRVGKVTIFFTSSIHSNHLIFPKQHKLKESV